MDRTSTMTALELADAQLNFFFAIIECLQGARVGTNSFFAVGSTLLIFPVSPGTFMS